MGHGPVRRRWRPNPNQRRPRRADPLITGSSQGESEGRCGRPVIDRPDARHRQVSLPPGDPGPGCSGGPARRPSASGAPGNVDKSCHAGPSSSHTRTQVVVVGGGPAGLMLSHAGPFRHRPRRVDTRSAEEIENTHRAGILEHDSVRLLSNRASQTGSSATATSTRGSICGSRASATGSTSRPSLEPPAGSTPRPRCSSTCYGARTRDGSDLRYGLATTQVVEFDQVARVRYEGSAGQVHEVEGDLVVGDDVPGSAGAR